MRLFALLLACVLLIPLGAKAFWIGDLQSAQGLRSYTRIQRVHATRIHFAYGGHLSHECRIAASLGGPCGCWASEYFFGHSVRSLWQARAWLLRFARVKAEPGIVAVWPHHVAPVVAVNGKQIKVADSWATHWRKSPGVFVDPHKPLVAMLVDFVVGIFR